MYWLLRYCQKQKQDIQRPHESVNLYIKSEFTLWSKRLRQNTVKQKIKGGDSQSNMDILNLKSIAKILRVKTRRNKYGLQIFWIQKIRNKVETGENKTGNIPLMSELPQTFQPKNILLRLESEYRRNQDLMLIH